jgi:hypothetical protein
MESNWLFPASFGPFTVQLDADNETGTLVISIMMYQVQVQP